MERVAAGKGYARDVIMLQLGIDFIHFSLSEGQPALLVPSDLVVAAGAPVLAARRPQNNPQPVAVKHIVLSYVVVPHDYILLLSFISAIFASFSRVSPLTLEYDR